MTKSTITRERIQRIIRAIDSEAYDEEEIREWLSSDEIMELSRMALAAMDSEPVAYISKSDFDAGYPHILARRDFNKACTMAVYAAQPAPVVPELRVDWQENEFSAGWNACRAAMLQTGTLINEGTIQAGNYPVIPEGWTDNDKANAALMMLDRIETIDSVDDDRIDGIKRIVRELAAATTGIPIISDTWIPVSERMPPSRHEVLVGCWWGEKPRWCCKWATYIPGHPDAQSSGWLIPGASWTPTHWMPLPAGPKEDINALIPLVSRNEQEGK
ncbi:DUF551 domain-containing protein [Klebsiella pneumoniae]|uniref:DUF551 domain-containing protein n=1 Tax=Klebsiella pneumoniae TaxID=573 RepID=UPI0038CF83B8